MFLFNGFSVLRTSLYPHITWSGYFNFSSSDEKLSKDKKLNTDVWYDEKTLNWVKASFEKKGKWEYKLILID